MSAKVNSFEEVQDLLEGSEDEQKAKLNFLKSITEARKELKNQLENVKSKRSKREELAKQTQSLQQQSSQQPGGKKEKKATMQPVSLAS